MEEKWQLVDLYRGRRSNFGNFDVVNLGKNITGAAHYKMAVFSATRHVLCRALAILIGCAICQWLGMLLTLDNHVSPVQVWGDATCLNWSRCHKAMHLESFRINWYAWQNPVTMWLCIRVIRFLSDKMWILNQIKLWKIRENLSRVVACLSVRWARSREANGDQVMGSVDEDQQEDIVVDEMNIEDASNLNCSRNPRSTAEWHEALATIVSDLFCAGARITL